MVEAIKSGEMSQLRENWATCLQVVFHAALAERAGHFDLAQVVDTVAQKMINAIPMCFPICLCKPAARSWRSGRDLKR